MSETIPSSNRVRIARQVLTRMALLLLLVGGIFFILLSRLLQSYFDDFEIKQYTEQLLRINSLLEQDKNNFSTTARDYSYWDDTYYFIEGTNPDHVQTNYVPSTLASMHIDGVILIDIKGKIHTALATTPDEMKPLSQEMINTLLAQIPAANSAGKQTEETRLFWQEETPIIFTLTEITNSDRTLPANGYQINFRRMDERYIRTISELSGITFSLQRKSNNTYDDILVRHGHNNWHKQDNWIALKSLPDLNAEISLMGRNHLHIERQIAMAVLLANTIGLVIISLLGIYAILHNVLLKRLSQFSELADRHRLTHNADIQWPSSGRDELDNLARSLNHFSRDMQHQNNNLLYLANHDTLTDLGNRRALFERLPKVALLKTPSYLLIIDIDNFKLINDGLGHLAGDNVLKIIAQRISMMAGYDSIVRLGGDEFAIILCDKTLEYVKDFCKKLEITLDNPIVLDAKEINVSVSIGVTHILEDIRAEDLLRNADLAMYESKRLGKKRAFFYEDTLLKNANRRLYLEHALLYAIKAEALEVWFQPTVNKKTNQVVGMEALVRWRINSEYIRPDEFIAVAESTGMITRLGNFVLDRACATVKMLQIDYPDLTCSVNLSMRQFSDSNLVEIVSDCLRLHDLQPSALHLELTESMVAEHEHVLLPTMKSLVAKGVQFHLDDFGVGYSSLKRLRELPIHTLKIDRSFVTPLQHGDKTMARMIIHMAHEFGMEIIAEGVETQGEADHLIAMGCDVIQGYLYARPMQVDELSEWLAQHALENRPHAPHQTINASTTQPRAQH